ncbi:citramalate synthase [bacterium]|nr:citramalate synthase [bacterium]
MAKKKHIQIYDTLLRDGTQAEDINFSVENKLSIAEKLDQLGVDFIEGGWPGASPRDTEFFNRAQTELKLKHAKLVAFGSTRKASNSAEEDRILNDLLASKAKVICIFGKTWDFHVKTALGISLDENLELIRSSLAYLKKNKRQVFYDAEHFFDGYKANPHYAIKTLLAAKKGGADVLVLCDTNGGTLPDEVSSIIKKVKSKVRHPLGIHVHNDGGLAVANSLAAVKAGAIQVQGTINGVGERCGNVNLLTVIANLELKMGYDAVGAKGLKNLTTISRFVDEMANRVGTPYQPFVGKSAFAHKGGMHVNAILKDSRTYEHINPELVGNAQRILVSDYSGASTISKKMAEVGVKLEANDPKVKQLLGALKNLENKGYEYEGAEASFEVLVKKTLGAYKPHFNLHSFTVTDNISEDEAKVYSRADIHLEVNGHSEKTTGEGVGPVHALDQALRKALERFYPVINGMKLLDYRVRVLPAGEGTASYVRVIIECGDGNSKWNTVGVSENILQASYQALVDAIDYKLLKDHL